MKIPLHIKRPRLLIVGCGDIGQRVAQKLIRRYRIFGVARSPETAQRLRQQGITPVYADLDQPRSLQRLQGLAHLVIHLAPPPLSGTSDPRTQALLTTLSRTDKTQKKRAIVAPGRLIYISTSGVYGDCRGESVTESRPVNPESPRAQRRVAAEAQIRALGKRGQWSTTILRVPGIHGPGRLPLKRLQGGQPVIAAEEDSWGNHVDADDLADAIIALLHSHRSQRVYNVCDSDPQLKGVYLNSLCRALGLPELPAISKTEAEGQLSPGLWSFDRESRRISNQRLLNETRWKPKIATVADLLLKLPTSPF